VANFPGGVNWKGRLFICCLKRADKRMGRGGGFRIGGITEENECVQGGCKGKWRERERGRYSLRRAKLAGRRVQVKS